MDLTLVTNKDVCSFLASRIRSARLQKGYSQAEMSEKTGIALRTYKRIELSGTGSIKNLIAILRTLERIRSVEILFSPPVTTRTTLIDRINTISKQD